MVIFEIKFLATVQDLHAKRGKVNFTDILQLVAILYTFVAEKKLFVITLKMSNQFQPNCWFPKPPKKTPFQYIWIIK